MSRRWINVAVCLISLLFGGVIYVWLRRETYIAGLFNAMMQTKALSNAFDGRLLGFFRYYCVDYLWGLSLSCGLVAINWRGRVSVAICACVSLACGVVWELLQFLGIVPGTGDIHDIILYLLASLTSIIMNQRRDLNEKN